MISWFLGYSLTAVAIVAILVIGAAVVWVQIAKAGGTWLTSLTLRGVLDFLRSPMALIVGAVVLAGCTFVAGHHVAARAAEAEKAASIEAARQVDQQAAAEAARRIQQQADENAARAAEAEKRFVEYANEVAQRPNPACSLLDPDVERLREDTVSGGSTRVTLPPKRGAGSNTAPVSKPRR